MSDKLLTIQVEEEHLEYLQQNVIPNYKRVLEEDLGKMKELSKTGGNEFVSNRAVEEMLANFEGQLDDLNELEEHLEKEAERAYGDRG